MFQRKEMGEENKKSFNDASKFEQYVPIICVRSAPEFNLFELFRQLLRHAILLNDYAFETLI